MDPEVVYQAIFDRLYAGSEHNVHPVLDRDARSRFWRSGIDRVRAALLLDSPDVELTLEDLEAELLTEPEPTPVWNKSWCPKLWKETLAAQRQRREAETRRRGGGSVPQPAQPPRPSSNAHAPVTPLRASGSGTPRPRQVAQVHAPPMPVPASSTVCPSPAIGTPTPLPVGPAPTPPTVTLGTGALSPHMPGQVGHRPRFGS